MYETHHGMSKYEVSCEELDFLNDLAREFGVTGSRVMGGGFGSCTINLSKEELRQLHRRSQEALQKLSTASSLSSTASSSLTVLAASKA